MRLQQYRVAGAGAGLLGVDAFPQCLKPVHVDDRGGDRDENAGQGADEAADTADFDLEIRGVEGMGSGVVWWFTR